jgi:hypothetical protein
MNLRDRIHDYIPYARELPARWDELAGVAQGSCLAIEDVLLMQMLEDLLDVDACTTAALAGPALFCTPRCGLPVTPTMPS